MQDPRVFGRQDRQASHVCCMQGAKKRLAAAEQALELVLEAQLATGQSSKCDEDGSEDSWPAGMQDDYVDSDAEVAADSDSDSNNSTMKQDANGQYNSSEGRLLAMMSAKAGNGAVQQSGLKAKSREGSEGEVQGSNWRLVNDESQPDSFSQVDLSRSPQEIKTHFPLFPVSMQPVLKQETCITLIDDCLHCPRPDVGGSKMHPSVHSTAFSTCYLGSHSSLTEGKSTWHA